MGKKQLETVEESESIKSENQKKHKLQRNATCLNIWYQT
jgi:hypothetical protein